MRLKQGAPCTLGTQPFFPSQELYLVVPLPRCLDVSNASNCCCVSTMYTDSDSFSSSYW